VAQSQRSPAPTETTSQFGVKVRDLESDEAQQLGVNGGVLVTDVESGSAADDGGIQPNDVIEEVGGKPVEGARAFALKLKTAASSGKSVVLLVNRDGNSRFVVLKLKS